MWVADRWAVLQVWSCVRFGPRYNCAFTPQESTYGQHISALHTGGRCRSRQTTR
jgi:hypothetical protein